MGREIRRVPAGWQHPTDDDGDYIPLFDGSLHFGHPLSAWQRSWDEQAAAWAEGRHPDQALAETEGRSFVEWTATRPMADAYSPECPDEDLTHWQYYETTTEGTPLSPVFATAAALAEWLVHHQDGWQGHSVDEAVAYVLHDERYVFDLDGWRLGPLGRPESARLLEYGPCGPLLRRIAELEESIRLGIDGGLGARVAELSRALESDPARMTGYMYMEDGARAEREACAAMAHLEAEKHRAEMLVLDLERKSHTADGQPTLAFYAEEYARQCASDPRRPHPRARSLSRRGPRR